MERSSLGHQPGYTEGTASTEPATTGAKSKAKSRAGEAYLEMRRRILENQWMPGFRALEQELAEQLQMSRTPVREALLRLQDEGLVDVIPRHGMRVLPVSAVDMGEIYQVLTALEALAAQLAARSRPKTAELKPLEDACQAMEAALETRDLDAWATADDQFHTQLVLLGGNTILTDSVMRFRDRAHRARLFTLRLRPLPEASTREHRRLLSAIAAGDEALTLKLHGEHRENSRRQLLQILEVFQIEQV
ncbi:MAG: GntR family transcriptional regulator [Burkholderiaceae bacterium]